MKIIVKLIPGIYRLEFSSKFAEWLFNKLFRIKVEYERAIDANKT